MIANPDPLPLQVSSLTEVAHQRVGRALRHAHEIGDVAHAAVGVTRDTQQREAVL